MTAPARRDDAAPTPAASGRLGPHQVWQEAVKIRQEWLEHGLSTLPADRETAERSLTAIYARISRPRPRLVWVDSPQQALPLIRGLPTLDDLYRWIRQPPRSGTAPSAGDVAMVASQLRGALSAGVQHTDPELSPARRGKTKQPWPELPPQEALDSGIPLAVVVHQGIRGALYQSLARGIYLPVRAVLAAHGPVPVSWYGQHDVSWVAYYDTLHRLGLARYRPDDQDHLQHWAALARSCGWWWPGEQTCVVVERPASARTEPIGGSRHDEIRLEPGGLRYRDGWQPLHA